jgi:hypothetical protein
MIEATLSQRKPVITVTVTEPAQIPANLIPVLVGGNTPTEPEVDFLAQYLLLRG